MEEETSEFGTGFSYCIGLFLMHAERPVYEGREDLWFYGAADHILELDIPDHLGEELCGKAQEFKNFCCGRRFDWKTSQGDKDKALRMAKDILMAYDRLNNVNVIQGDYE